VLGVVWVLVEGMHDAVVSEHLGDDLLAVGFLHQGARIHAVGLLPGAVVGQSHGRGDQGQGQQGDSPECGAERHGGRLYHIRPVTDHPVDTRSQPRAGSPVGNRRSHGGSGSLGRSTGRPSRNVVTLSLRQPSGTFELAEVRSSSLGRVGVITADGCIEVNGTAYDAPSVCYI
jgi:hypothetical protein